MSVNIPDGRHSGDQSISGGRESARRSFLGRTFSKIRGLHPLRAVGRAVSLLFSSGETPASPPHKGPLRTKEKLIKEANTLVQREEAKRRFDEKFPKKDPKNVIMDAEGVTYSGQPSKREGDASGQVKLDKEQDLADTPPSTKSLASPSARLRAYTKAYTSELDRLRGFAKASPLPGPELEVTLDAGGKIEKILYGNDRYELAKFMGSGKVKEVQGLSEEAGGEANLVIAEINLEKLGLKPQVFLDKVLRGLLEELQVAAQVLKQGGTHLPIIVPRQIAIVERPSANPNIYLIMDRGSAGAAWDEHMDIIDGGAQRNDTDQQRYTKLISLLEALIGLQQAGFSHGDLTWNNTLPTQDDGSGLALIDLGQAISTKKLAENPGKGVFSVICVDPALYALREMCNHLYVARDDATVSGFLRVIEKGKWEEAKMFLSPEGGTFAEWLSPKKGPYLQGLLKDFGQAEIWSVGTMLHDIIIENEDLPYVARCAKVSEPDSGITIDLAELANTLRTFDYESEKFLGESLFPAVKSTVFPNRLWNVFIDCFDPNPAKRPTLQQLLDAVKNAAKFNQPFTIPWDVEYYGSDIYTLQDPVVGDDDIDHCEAYRNYWEAVMTDETKDLATRAAARKNFEEFDKAIEAYQKIKACEFSLEKWRASAQDPNKSQTDLEEAEKQIRTLQTEILAYRISQCEFSKDFWSRFLNDPAKSQKDKDSARRKLDENETALTTFRGGAP